MNVNYYVHTPNGEQIHLGGQSSPGRFYFRAHPDRDVMSYEAWLGLLDLGEVRAEHGRVCTKDELVGYANELAPRWAYTNSGPNQFLDGRYLFTTVEFC
jgi:hypothetical protein